MRSDHDTWRKSTHSGQEGTTCVELANLGTTWRTSSHTGQEGGTCVELASLGVVIGVRDSTDPQGPVLQFSRPAVAGLVRRIKTGELDQ
ncbi:hypothetical protein GCM10022254_70790 [Actinomadura meridiana]|uniref:DUF397 domain-containing protein n=1 Tax=Actinomadura meridiana TaxID=559626 RepID=A0ABP8CNI2_9ACTN